MEAPDPVPAPPAAELPPLAVEPTLQKTEATAAPKKPLFWSAAPAPESIAPAAAEAPESLTVPPVLRNFKKCATCGFPISSGRTLCVECEDKKFRGQTLPKPAAATAPPAASDAAERSHSVFVSKGVASVPAPPEKPAIAVARVSHAAEPGTPAAAPDLVLSAAAPSPSWFAANKFILGALLVVAVVVAAIAWLR
jgi:hypothetical protein